MSAPQANRRETAPRREPVAVPVTVPVRTPATRPATTPARPTPSRPQPAKPGGIFKLIAPFALDS
jgi:hypothetical protein